MEHLLNLRDKVEGRLDEVLSASRKVEPGSEESARLALEAEKLLEQINAINAQLHENDVHFDQMELENKKHESEVKQNKITNRIEAAKVGVSVAGLVIIIADQVVKAKEFDIAMAFEETGHICGTLMKGLANNMFKSAKVLKP